jgi:hypothetical protein
MPCFYFCSGYLHLRVVCLWFREPWRTQAFTNIFLRNYEQETIAHVSNRLAMAKLTLAKGKPMQYSLDFIKSCLTFNEVTIPSINDIFKRVHLFIETAEVSCEILYCLKVYLYFIDEKWNSFWR